MRIVTGDMLSHVLVPMPDLGAADPIEDYLSGLRLLEAVAWVSHVYEAQAHRLAQRTGRDRKCR